MYTLRTYHLLHNTFLKCFEMHRIEHITSGRKIVAFLPVLVQWAETAVDRKWKAGSINSFQAERGNSWRDTKDFCGRFVVDLGVPRARFLGCSECTRTNWTKNCVIVLLPSNIWNYVKCEDMVSVESGTRTFWQRDKYLVNLGKLSRNKTRTERTFSPSKTFVEITNKGLSMAEQRFKSAQSKWSILYELQQLQLVWIHRLDSKNVMFCFNLKH